MTTSLSPSSSGSNKRNLLQRRSMTSPTARVASRLPPKSTSKRKSYHLPHYPLRKGHGHRSLRTIFVAAIFIIVAVQFIFSLVLFSKWSDTTAEQNNGNQPSLLISNRLRKGTDTTWRSLYNSKKGRRPYSVGGIDDLSALGYEQRPIHIAHHFEPFRDETNDARITVVKSLPVDNEVYPTKRYVDNTEGWFGQIHSSDYYGKKRHKKYDLYKNYSECQSVDDWQTLSFPTCNTVHEQAMTTFFVGDNHDHRNFYYKSHGFFRDIWVTRDSDMSRKIVLKTLQMDHSYDPLNFERHRIDAVASERMTSSDYFIDIYGYCGQSSLYPYGTQGSMNNLIWPDSDNTITTHLEKFKAGVMVAEAIAELHNFNKGKPPGAIVHTDIMTNQFIMMDDGFYRLGDFNRAVFAYWNTTSDDGYCPFKYPDTNAWIFRAPEEYAYSFQTEKIDIYSMGNVFYTLLHEEFPFKEELDGFDGEDYYKEIEKIGDRVFKGERPQLRDEMMKSTNPSVVGLRKAMNMCWEQDWRKRPSAIDVRNFMRKTWKDIQEWIRSNPQNPEIREPANRQQHEID